MWKRPKRLIASSLCLTLTLLVSGCANAPSGSAICDGTAQSRTSHATALAEDGGPQSMVTGALLIQQIDAGCGY
jgi:hypothetical protein